MNSPDETDVIYRETTERFWILRLITEVRTDGLYLRLFPIHRSFRCIPPANIAEVDIATYSPATYSGWHWGVKRSLSGNTVYRLRGDQGVEVLRNGGTKIFIGSPSPSQLQQAVQRIMGTP